MILANGNKWPLEATNPKDFSPLSSGWLYSSHLHVNLKTFNTALFRDVHSRGVGGGGRCSGQEN